MLKEFLHLAYLLTKHECVVIPGFGAFVAYPVLASGRQTAGMFPAPAQSLGFNPELIHNDGLLANSVMKEHKISYAEANLRVRRFADELISRLKINNEVYIPGIGKLILSAENKIVFNPADILTCNAANYGFSNFYLPSLTELERLNSVPEKVIEENKDVVWIPLSRRFLKTVGSVAAGVLAFLLFSTPLDDHRMPVQSASMFLSVKNQKIEMTDPVINIEEVEPKVNITEESTIEKNTETLPVVTQDVAKPSRMYFIVISSLPTQKLADAKLAEIQSAQFQHAQIISNAENFRIYVEKFADKAEAETYLETFRISHPEYNQAWLLSQKVTL